MFVGWLAESLALVADVSALLLVWEQWAALLLKKDRDAREATGRNFQVQREEYLKCFDAHFLRQYGSPGSHNTVEPTTLSIHHHANNKFLPSPSHPRATQVATPALWMYAVKITDFPIHISLSYHQ